MKLLITVEFRVLGVWILGEVIIDKFKKFGQVIRCMDYNLEKNFKDLIKTS